MKNELQKIQSKLNEEKLFKQVKVNLLMRVRGITREEATGIVWGFRKRRVA